MPDFAVNALKTFAYAFFGTGSDAFEPKETVPAAARPEGPGRNYVPSPAGRQAVEGGRSGDAGGEEPAAAQGRGPRPPSGRSQEAMDPT